VTVINSTFAGNTGGGAFANEGSFSLKGTVLADSVLGNCDNNGALGGTLTDEGYNLSDDDSCGFETANPSTTSKDNVSNLNLDALADNGGPTETIALGNGSAAIGFIPEASCTYQNVNPCTNPPAVSASGPLVCDQRGEPRPNPGANPPACDSGAFELQTFTQFKPALSVNLPDSFLLLSKFALGSGDSVDLATQAVTVTLSSADLTPVSLTIPAGSFKKVAGVYLFEGEINGVSAFAELIPQANKSNYTFEISASGLELTGISNPVTVTLQVGPNTGTAAITATIK
jgi:hypothetical protein